MTESPFICLYLDIMDYYKKKVAIVTGGASGIGRALCEELGRRGAKVIAADINTEGAERTAKAITAAGGWAGATYLDVTKADDVSRLIQKTAYEHGRLDFMFNNAGIVSIGDARDMDIEHWHRILDINLNGVIYGSITAYHLMARQGFGHIVNIASAAGLLPVPLQAPYVTTKFGVVGLSQTLRLEGAKLGVKVSVVCPGFVRTEMFSSAQVLRADKEKVVAKVPPGIIVNVKDAAQHILNGVARNKAVIVFPFSVRLLWFLYRLFPLIAGPFARSVLKDFRSLRKED